MIKILFANKSLIRKLLFPMILILIIQMIIFAFTINYGGTIEYIRNNSCDLFQDDIDNSVRYMQNTMLSKWGNLSEYGYRINEELLKIAKINSLEVHEFSSRNHAVNLMLSSSSNMLLNLLRKNSVTGTFLIINTDDPESLNALYLRDLDPSQASTDNSDILVEIGSPSIIGKLNLTMDSNWMPKLNLKNASSSDFFYEPLNAATKNPTSDYNNYGYWSMPFRMNSSDLEVITYTIPLITSDGVPYAVLGVEINVDYFRTQMPYTEFSSPQHSAYALAKYSSDNVYQKIVTNSTTYKKMLGNSNAIYFNEEPYYVNIFTLSNKNAITPSKIYGCIKPVKLYSPTSPFSDNWYFIGLMEEEYLFSFAKTVTTSFNIALFISFLIGLIGIIISGLRFTKPITELVTQVKNTSLDKVISFNEVNIYEIDELARSIETLNQNILDSSAKLSQILELSNLSIGAFEFDPHSDKVFCTDVLLRFLNIDSELVSSGYILKTIFLKRMSSIITDLAPNINKVFELKANNRITWLKLNTTDNKGKILGVLMDVTNETFEKMKIEHERDHDSMTHLYNRRAFLSRLKERLNQPQKTLGALIMCDLDNLKVTNDMYGHAVGDEYIKAAADALSFLSQYNGIIARMSGDEFYAYIDGFEDKEEGRKIFSKFHALLHTMFIRLDDDTIIPIKASCGVSWFPDDAEDYELLLKYADFAMYEVKNSVKNDLKEFDMVTYKQSTKLLKGKHDLDRLILEQLIAYAFQPIVDAHTGEVYGYEALMRPQIDTLKNPSDVMSLATLQRKLDDIEHLTWFKVLEIYVREKEKFADAKLFLNSIPNQLLSASDLDYIDTVYNKHLHNVVLEIIESEKADESIVNNKRDFIRKFNGLIALDDFGSGYSNDRALLTLKPDLIKIDMDIIRNIDTDPDRQRLMQNLVFYAHERNIKVIAEGVETLAELKTVIKFKVDLLQGYIVCKPAFDIIKPAFEISEIIRKFAAERDMSL